MRVQAKICGVRTPEIARVAVEAGADAVGLVFHPKSPRCVTISEARAVVEALPAAVAAVGVFADEPPEKVLEIAAAAGIHWVQLHGAEAPGCVKLLRAAGLKVIKALFANRPPDFSAAARYEADAFLVECAGGALPGGNAKTWDYAKARGAGGAVPLILAGGLSPENVAKAAALALPGAVDASSSLESAPGEKDPARIRRFLDSVKSLNLPLTKRIFP